MYHVYQIINRQSKEILYVGCSCRLTQRAKAHAKRFGPKTGMCVCFSTENLIQATNFEMELLRDFKAMGQARFNYAEMPYLGAKFSVSGIEQPFDSLKAVAKHLGNHPMTVARYVDSPYTLLAPNGKRYRVTRVNP